MIILPAIDLYDGKAVRLYKGDYSQMTVYGDDPVKIAKDFVNQGASYIHIVDLEGARYGETPNLGTVEKIIAQSGLFAEIGGGIRDLDTVERYIKTGAKRIILGTAAVQDERFLYTAAEKYGDLIAVGVDIKDGFVAVRGWTEKTGYDCFGFCKKLQDMGIGTVICTDISKDGAMKGTNLPLYMSLSEQFKMNIIASGGVSTIDDVKRLRNINVYGAIIGKAYYEGTISLREAIEVAE